MIQYRYKLNNNDMALYGFDAPTGGYFLSILGDDDEEKFLEDGITLQKLLFLLKSREINNYNIKELISDFYDSKYPSPLQIHIMQCFGKDIKEMLQNCKENIETQFIK